MEDNSTSGISGDDPLADGNNWEQEHLARNEGKLLSN